MHPLADDISALKDSELENKISELNKKYFMTNNTGIRAQIASLLENYKNALAARRSAEWQKMIANRDKDLDKLINVS